MIIIKNKYSFFISQKSNSFFTQLYYNKPFPFTPKMPEIQPLAFSRFVLLLTLLSSMPLTLIPISTPRSIGLRRGSAVGARPPAVTRRAESAPATMPAAGKPHTDHGQIFFGNSVVLRPLL